MQYRPPLEVNPADRPEASIIWLHGLGANGHDFLPIVDELDLSALPPTRFVFPHAPEQAVTLNNGYVMPAWYDLVGLDDDAPEDIDGMRTSITYIHRLIEHEIVRGIRSDRIVLAGFSQGGNIALNSALRYPAPLAGGLILSAYLGMPDALPVERAPANQQLPIFIAHGTLDNIVPYAWAENMRQSLEALKHSVEWHAYPMLHTVCAEEVVDIGKWLSRILMRKAG